jgi:hypothetical protein
MTTAAPYRALSDDVRLNSSESNAALDLLVTTEIKVLPLFECDPLLFAAMRDEALALVAGEAGQAVNGDHPTAAYVHASDPAWHVKPGTIHQYSLYNSADDVLFNDEDHHWLGVERRVNPRLPAVREFVSRYFGRSALQNFRMQSIRGGSDLGRHRERIVGIPGRERQFKLRFHLPIVTNPGVTFWMDGAAFTMKAGWVYLFNQGCMHGVSNEGAELRIHYIFDCYLDDEIVSGMLMPAWQRAVAGTASGT